MIAFVVKYVKICFHCRKIKTYKKTKQNLFKSLFISNRYFKKITMNFIDFLLTCKRDDKTYKYVMIVIDRFFKIVKFAILHFIDVDVVIQTFINWIWRTKNFSKIIIFDREIQFVVDFWKRLNKRFRSHLKWFTTWHSKIDDQIEIINVILKKYIRIYCNYQQNDWFDLLFFAKFEINSISSNFIIVVSFLTIKNYIFRFDFESFTFMKNISTIIKKMKNANAFVKKIANFQKYFKFQLIWARVKQKKTN